MNPRLIATAALAATAATILLPAAVATAEGSPTCQDTIGTEVHGQHIIGDYVTGLGAVFPPNELTWPPNGQVGPAMQENQGAVLPGGPGPSFHFLEGLAPGASFCTGAHPNGFEVPEHFQS